MMLESSMGKGLSIAGLVASIMLLLVFGLDLAIGLPFGQPDMTLEIGFVVGAAILVYMSVTTLREQK